jgi:hypothetical protein
VSKITAFLDDYAFLVDGLLALEAATGEADFLREAERLQAEQDERLLDPRGGYFAAGEDPKLLFRAKPAFDGAVASGNGVTARNLVGLYGRTGKEAYRERARGVFAAFAEAMADAPAAHVTLIDALERLGAVAAERPAVAVAAAAPRAAAGAGATAGLEDEAREVVEIEARLAPGPEGFREFTLDLRVRPGFHLQPHEPDAPGLVATSVQAVLGQVRDVRFPAGEAVRLGGEARRVYRGHVQVTGAIEAPPAGAPSLEVTYQACDEARCLPAVTRLVRFS